MRTPARPLLVCALLLAAAVARAAPEAARPTLAVLYFDYAGKDEQLGVLRKGLAQMLISDLSGSQGQVQLVERDRLEEVLKELQLGQSGKIDSKSAARIGKLLGARYMVLGSYFDLLGTLRADARLVEVETGKVLRSVGVNGQPGDFLSLEQRLHEALGQAIAGVLGRPPALPAAPAQDKGAQLARKERPKPPAQLKVQTAVRYARALDAMDRGDRAMAKAALQTVVKEQPDFRLAALDLDRLLQ